MKGFGIAGVGGFCRVSGFLSSRGLRRVDDVKVEKRMGLKEVRALFNWEEDGGQIKSKLIST